GLFIFLFYALLKSESRDAWRSLCCRSDDNALISETPQSNGRIEGLSMLIMTSVSLDLSGNRQPYELATSSENSFLILFS
ncbi:hypothetical protein BaRGS_00017173, partial [Batillaria attramentaria]